MTLVIILFAEEMRCLPAVCGVVLLKHSVDRQAETKRRERKRKYR